MVEPGVIPTTNSCNQIQEDALALLASELNDEQERQVLIHLATCQRCREEFRRDRAMMRMLHACPTITAAGNFDDMLNERLLNEGLTSSNNIKIGMANERSDITLHPASQTPKLKKPKPESKKPK